MPANPEVRKRIRARYRARHLRCASCQAPMRGVRGGGRIKPYLYYACSDRRRYGTCSAPFVPAAVLEQELVGWLAKCHPG